MTTNPFPKLTVLAREPGQERLRKEIEAYLVSVATVKPKSKSYGFYETQNFEKGGKSVSEDLT